MNQVIVYLRVSTDDQDVANQRHGVEAFCRQRGFEVAQWVEDVVSGGKAIAERKLGKVVKRMKAGDVLVAAEISRLSRSTLDLMSLLQTCMTKGIRVMTVKDGYELGDNVTSKVLAFAFGLSAEIERDMIRQRIKEALARRKASGIKLGRRPGSRKSNPKLLPHLETVRAMAEAGSSQIAIAKKLRCHRHTVADICEENGIVLVGSKKQNASPGRADQTNRRN